MISLLIYVAKKSHINDSCIIREQKLIKDKDREIFFSYEAKLIRKVGGAVSNYGLHLPICVLATLDAATFVILSRSFTVLGEKRYISRVYLAISRQYSLLHALLFIVKYNLV
jgi:hypothetical protein